ncbi:MAG: hypothetical protein GY749_00560, partial [Desulfobacteraceae bacterium]|nr:hypothetical protein [Desulfobacteraceae bacterium]
KLGDSLKIPLVLVPMLRVGMQGAALRADIPKAKFVRQISVPQLMDAPKPNLPPIENIKKIRQVFLRCIKL